MKQAEGSDDEDRARPVADAGAGAGAGADAAKARVERELRDSVHFLTAGQRCWDWFNQRMGHVTGSVANKFSAFNRQLVRKHAALRRGIAKAAAAATAASHDAADEIAQAEANRKCQEAVQARDLAWGELYGYFIDMFRRLRAAWFGTHKGNAHTRAGTENEPKMAAALRADDKVHHVFDVGMVENKRTSWLGCSADGIILGDFSSVVPNDDVAATQRPLPLELKTMTVPRTVNKYTDIARMAEREFNGTWTWCRAATPTFRRLVPNADHRSQLIHQAATFESPAVVYAVGTTQRILYKVIVLVPTAVRRQHVARLSVVAEPLLGWLYRADAKPPAFAPFDHAEVIQSHHQMWWALRLHVIKHGPLHPVFQMRNAIVVLYNNVMGGVDAVDRATTSTNATSCISFKHWEPAVLVTTIHKGVVNNAVRLYRLTRCRSWLEDDKWKRGGWSGFLRRLRSVDSTKTILCRAGIDVLLKKGVRPSRQRAAAAAAPAAPREGGAAAGTAAAAAILQFQEQVSRAGKRTRKRLLLSTDGVSFRRSDLITHARVQDAKSAACAHCHYSVVFPLTGDQERELAETPVEERPKKRRRLLQRQRRGYGGHTKWRCSACQVPVCTKSTSDCWDRWHRGEQPRRPPAAGE